ncbi:MAG: hypothetical protein COT73_13060 [Bdellovibrio sp. CG10_big_fil_rev_8_21_14_0_10_47_8]|nr:MAG: hypothetical protein COT73_13060 [Bdellovibrio sp. CG10_big_fil_rev_8_21_14_0_10_47_8]
MARLSNPVNIYALHGFLGRPSDFDLVEGSFRQLNEADSMAWHLVDYMSLPTLGPKTSLANWGPAMNSWVQQEFNLDSQKSKNFLVGYSQGGRLALQALRASPQLWAGAILISTNPGIPENERKDRHRQDLIWAERFEHDDFSLVVRDWNQQSVFVGSRTEPLRRADDYDRHQLALCLNNWSVSQQEDFRSFLRENDRPLLYAAGERDTKYVELGLSLQKVSDKVEFCSIENSGHRILIDQPLALAQVISRFVSRV